VAVRPPIPVPIGRRDAISGIRSAVLVGSAGLPVRGGIWVPVCWRAAVPVAAHTTQLILPVTVTISPVRSGHSSLRAALAVLPSAFPLRGGRRRPVLRPGPWISPRVSVRPLGLSGVPVSGRERFRPNRPELAQPLLGRGFAEVGLRPLVSGPPAEYHLCRHPAKKIPPHHQYSQRALARPTGAQILHADAGLLGLSFMSSSPRWPDGPRRSPGPA
jgi:hypothetical protein